MCVWYDECWNTPTPYRVLQIDSTFFLQEGKLYSVLVLFYSYNKGCSYRVFVTISKQNNLKPLNDISNIHLE